MGYHLKNITKGEYGKLSKIQEELDECIDAEEQHCRIMLLTELSDLYGALEGYLKEHFPNFTMKDLRKMSEATSCAFESGART